jgi:hypothetical protein
MTSFIKKLSPKKIFLIDGVGAVLSSIGLLLLLFWQEHIGMPLTVLKKLIVITLFFSSYSLCCYQLVEKKWILFLSFIALCNFLYCLLTLKLIFEHRPTLTQFGITYFILEILIIFGVVIFEIKFLSQKSSS